MIATLYALVLVSLLLIMGMRPERSALSRFELERRARSGDPKAKFELRRDSLLHDIYSLQQVMTAVLLVTLSALGVVLFDSWLGFLVSLLVALEAGAVSRLSAVWRPANLIYGQIESKLLDWVERFPKLFWLIRSVTPRSGGTYILRSHEELVEIVNQSDEALSEQEKRLVTHALGFESRQVKEIMTPRDDIKSIDKRELVGPLVLDELHQTGHSRFPVVDKNLDNVVGMLHIRSLINLDQKRSLTAEKAMDPKVYYVRQDQNLATALASFLKTRHHLFVVVDADGKTVGIVSLEDVIEALIGRELRDEFDAYDKVDAVARRSL